MRRVTVWASAIVLSIMSMLAISSQASASTPYTLTADGTWVSADGLLHGTWSAHFDVAGFDLSGTATILGLPEGAAEGNLAGSWDLDNIGFGVMFLDQELAAFQGGLQGDQLVGTFEHGDITGTWSGLLSNLNISNVPIAPILNETLPTLLLNHTSGNLGDIVNLVATLYTVGAPIAGIENTIDFDLATPILSLASGAPDCSVNPAINKLDTIFEFLPKGCSGSACKQVRAVVQSLSNLDAIANGASLYTCKVKIAQDAASGIYQLIATAIKAVDTSNFQLPLSAISGEIGAKLPFFKQIFAKHGCHCSTVATAGPLPISSLLLPLALIALRRRARDRRPNA